MQISLQRQIANRRVLGEEDAGEGRKGTRKLLGVTDSMFIILTAVAVSQVYGYVRTYQTVPFKYVQLVVCP